MTIAFKSESVKSAILWGWGYGLSALFHLAS